MLLAKTLERGGGRDPWSEEKRLAAERLIGNFQERLAPVHDLGLAYLSLERSTPTLSAGELQRLRLAAQIRSNLFGVVYVMDEPSAGLHPADTQALLRALEQRKLGGNSLFVVEHDLDVMRRAQWIVDVGPEAGAKGGKVLYSGPLEGLREIAPSHTSQSLFAEFKPVARQRRAARGWLELKGVSRNNLQALDVSFPLGVLTVVTGVSGAGIHLVSEALPDLLAEWVAGHKAAVQDEPLEEPALNARSFTQGRIARGADLIQRVVTVNQKPIGRTPRSNWRPTRASSTTYAISLRQPRAPRHATMRPAASLLTSKADAAKPVKAKVSCASSCYSCRACTRPAPPVTGTATSSRPYRCGFGTRTSPRYLH